VSLKPRFMPDSVIPLKTLGFGAKPQLKVAAKFRFRHNQDNLIMLDFKLGPVLEAYFG